MDPFLMKASTLTKPDILNKDEYLWSVKMDGMRAFWDGGNHNPNNPIIETLSEKDKTRITGLWSINLKPISAPKWWLDKLPKHPIDGELWAGQNNFQKVISTCKEHVPSDNWKNIKLMAFDSPDPKLVFQPRKIKVQGGSFNITQEIYDHYKNLEYVEFSDLQTLNENEFFGIVKYYEYDGNWNKFNEQTFPELLANGNEGVVFRKKSASWEPKRSKNLYKLKPYLDAEGTVVGYISGNKTDKDSRWFGMLGSLILEIETPDGGLKTFNLSGMNSEERILYGDNIEKFDGVKLPDHVYSKIFPISTTVTYKYRELTKDGIPKEASYWRKRPNE